MYQMWCADERKIEHVFYTDISHLVTRGNHRDTERFWNSREFFDCKRFTVECFFGGDSFATCLSNTFNFTISRDVFKDWVKLLPKTAEHVEILFEHEKVSPAGGVTGPDYWDQIMQYYPLDLGTFLVDEFRDIFTAAPKIDHIKTLVISCGQDLTLCPEHQTTWKKDKKEKQLMVVPNELYPAQKNYLDKKPNHRNLEIWQRLCEGEWPGEPKDIDQEEVNLIYRAKCQWEDEEKHRHKEEMAPWEASSRRENQSLAERRQIQVSRRRAREYRAHSSRKRKRINSSAELSRGVVKAARRMQKLAKRRRNSSGDQSEINVTQLKELIRPENGERQDRRVKFLDWHLPRLKVRSRRRQDRDLDWRHPTRKWRPKYERYNDEIKDGGKQAGTSFKKWIDCWEHKCDHPEDTNSDHSDNYYEMSDSSSEDGSDDSDGDGNNLNHGNGSNPTNNDVDNSAKDDNNHDYLHESDSDYYDSNEEDVDVIMKKIDGNCERAGIDLDSGDKDVGDDERDGILMDDSYQEAPDANRSTEHNGTQGEPIAISIEEEDATSSNENSTRATSESPKKRKREDQADQGRNTKRERARGEMRVHKDHTYRRLKPNSDSENEEPRQSRTSKGKATSSALKKRASTSPFGKSKGKFAFGIAKGKSAYGKAKENPAVASAGNSSRQLRRRSVSPNST